MLNPLKKIKKYYKGSIKRFDKEEVHEFRVEVKKLRALIRLLFYNKAGRKVSIPATVKGLYSCTGNIRNLQLQEDRILHITFRTNVWPGNYVSFLRAKQQAWKIEATRYKQEKPVKPREAKRFSKALKKLDKKQLRTYAIHQSSLLQNLLFLEHFEDDDLHQLRKFLKDILYNWKYIKGFIIVQLPFYLHRKKEIETFTVLLGEFQDVCIALELLEKEFYPYPLRPEQMMFEAFRKELGLKKLYLKKRILNILTPSIIPVHNHNMENFFFNYRNGLP
jgi:CHAD domain-containing protein